MSASKLTGASRLSTRLRRERHRQYPPELPEPVEPLEPLLEPLPLLEFVPLSVEHPNKPTAQTTRNAEKNRVALIVISCERDPRSRFRSRLRHLPDVLEAATLRVARRHDVSLRRRVRNASTAVTKRAGPNAYSGRPEIFCLFCGSGDTSPTTCSPSSAPH